MFDLYKDRELHFEIFARKGSDFLPGESCKIPYEKDSERALTIALARAARKWPDADEVFAQLHRVSLRRS